MKKASFLAFFLSLTILVSAASIKVSQEKIVIEARRITSFDPENESRSRFGSLEFRGGLVLSSASKHFGGFSALRVQPDTAHFVAVSDRTYWLQGRITYTANRPSAIVDAIMAPVLNTKGKPAKNWDTESIAESGKTLYLGIEGMDSIMRYDFGRKGIFAAAQPVPVPPGARKLPKNKGLEALVFIPKPYRLQGTLLAFSERGLDSSGNLEAFLIGGPRPGNFSVKRNQEFDISDAALLPGGDLLILERKFFLLEGITVRIRRIHWADIKPGATVDGPVLFEANGRYEIDNMEALSVNRNSAGEIILTLMSDDNFSIIQRTLLLQFALIEGIGDSQIRRDR